MYAVYVAVVDGGTLAVRLIDNPVGLNFVVETVNALLLPVADGVIAPVPARDDQGVTVTVA